MKKLIVLFPTPAEAAEFTLRGDRRIETIVCGVGAYRCAASTASAVWRELPDAMVLGGICGMFDGSALAMGDVVSVGAERAADMGRFAGDTFEEAFGERLENPDARFLGLPVAEGVTVGGVGSPYINPRDAQIENMEGVAFFHAALAAQIPFWEVRAVSNRVGEPCGLWRMSEAIGALGTTLDRVCADLLKMG